MPLFTIHDKKLNLQKITNFKLEKEIQNLIENNLETVFNCRFIATEFSTGQEHAGRIDSLGLNVEVDWSDVRVICIAPGYKKYDLHAVQMMGANIELWQYKLYENGTLYLEETFRRSTNVICTDDNQHGKNPVMVEAGKKAAQTRLSGVYSVEEHQKAMDKSIEELFMELREYIIAINETIEESPKKFYIAYKVSQNFTCIETRKNKLILYLKIDPKSISIPKNGRDVSDIGHYGTGDFELSISNFEELERAKEYIIQSYENIGG